MLYEMLKQLIEKIFNRLKYATINVTVKDPLNNPIQRATIQIVALNITRTTDATGKATLQKVPYGNQIIKITTL